MSIDSFPKKSDVESNPESLSVDEIKFLAENQSWMPGNIPFLRDYLMQYRHGELIPFLEYILSHDVVEIGPGGNPLNEFVRCGSYTGVQPFECHVPDIGAEEYVIQDGLTYLKGLPDNSVVVVSFGVLDESVLNYSQYSNNSNLPVRYMKELAKEIKRVSSPFAIVVGLDVCKYMGPPNFVKMDWGGVEGGFGGVYACDEDAILELNMRASLGLPQGRGLVPGDFWPLSGLVGDYINAFGAPKARIKLNRLSNKSPFEDVHTILLYRDYFHKTFGESLETAENKQNIVRITNLAEQANNIIRSKDQSKIEHLFDIIRNMEVLLRTGEYKKTS